MKFFYLSILFSLLSFSCDSSQGKIKSLEEIIKVLKEENRKLKVSNEEKDKKNQSKKEVKEKEKQEVKKKEKKKKLTDFDFFKEIHWPFYLENECGCSNNPEKEKCKPRKCCNTIKGDKGGYTCYGVAIKSNEDFYKLVNHLEGKDRDLEIEKYAQLQIYSKYYVRPKIVDLALVWREPVLDFAVHWGQGRAIRTLQRILGLKADGIIGSKTIVESFKNKDYKKYNRSRYEQLKKAPSYKKFPAGFDLRIKRIKRQSKEAEKLYETTL